MRRRADAHPSIRATLTRTCNMQIRAGTNAGDRKHSQAFASIRKHSQAFASIRKHSQAFESMRKHSQAFAIFCIHSHVVEFV
jgi:hypothetical protein